jgi:hypothetical protein
MSDTSGSPRGYAGLKQLAKAAGVRIPDLLALARQNDPFFAGSPAQREKADWFAALWERFNYRAGVHLRRVHYQLVSQEAPRKHDGTPYHNTEAAWAYLGEAGKAARYLGLVAPDAFVDRRNPDPVLAIAGVPERVEVGWSLERPFGWGLPRIDASLSQGLSFALPSIQVRGYDYSPTDQPFLLEIWVEKSTMHDVLEPLCRRLSVNLVPGAGFQSITSPVNLLQRVARLAASGKPCRVFYISDFDPAGDQMPVAVARQLEFWLPQYAPGADIKLTPLVLTREQVIAYRLPRTPIKDSDLRKTAFEGRYGEGAVELDALEALFPGELGRIVRGAVAPYRDETLAERLFEAEEEARQAANDAYSGGDRRPAPGPGPATGGGTPDCRRVRAAVAGHGRRPAAAAGPDPRAPGGCTARRAGGRGGVGGRPTRATGGRRPCHGRGWLAVRRRPGLPGATAALPGAEGRGLTGATTIGVVLSPPDKRIVGQRSAAQRREFPARASPLAHEERSATPATPQGPGPLGGVPREHPAVPLEA